MKNVLNSFLSAALFLSLAACKNDKPAATETTATTPITTPTTSAPTTSPMTTPEPAPTTTTKAAVPTPDKVAPSTAASTPTAETPIAKANGKVTSVKFDELTYDWGSVKDGDKMTHVFKFKNTGTNDLVISDARGSCGCTVPEWPKEPIKPGKSNEIKVVFDSKGKVGDAVQKTVTLTMNTEQSQMMLTIKGKVTAKE